MNKYELNIKIAQIQQLLEERKYKKASAVLETIDVHQLRSREDLNVAAEVYVKTEQFEEAKDVYLRLYKKRRTKRILYRLIYLAIRTNELEDVEKFYKEFLGMSHSTRDNLVLRYRIDKAKGVPISHLIELLETLKEEEYVEEWAYELAKLYQKAGRNDDCRRECEDIILWFGQGEIVERADMLLDYLDGDPQLYYEDKDYTLEEQEEPNPDDTGSLPDLSPEIIKQEKEKLKQKKKQERIHRRESSRDEEEEFIDDYDEETDLPEDEMQMEPGELIQKARDSFLKLPGFRKRENRQEDGASRPGMGITQDLAKEISAIVEAERKEQLKEKAVTLVSEVPGTVAQASNVAVSVVDRMTQAMQNKVGKSYISLNVNQPRAGQETEDILQQPEEKYPVPAGQPARKPDGMEEIIAGEPVQKEEEVIMIELDQIMPEPDMPELKQAIPQDSPELGNQPELEEKELPTTKALHHSFDDILTLIAGEREPKHFVLMGEGNEKIIGLTKKIVRVMNKKGFMSTNQIARIHSRQLNSMNLLQVCGQIKGSCLLIDEAAKLSFPTITKIFAVMDAFHGDFVVVLADEGNTLDELFRVAPALARRFEYVIDISQYGEKDYL